MWNFYKTKTMHHRDAETQRKSLRDFFYMDFGVGRVLMCFVENGNASDS